MDRYKTERNYSILSAIFVCVVSQINHRYLDHIKSMSHLQDFVQYHTEDDFADWYVSLCDLNKKFLR
jgi:hypothetical protein